LAGSVLRILHVLPSLELAGTQRFVTTLAVAQARAGDEPTVVSLTRDPAPGFVAELEAAKVGVISIRKGPGMDPRVPGIVRAIAKRTRADVVHTHGYALTYGLLAQLSPRRRAAHTLHATMDIELGRATAPFYPVAHRLGVRFAAISDAVSASCAERFGFSPPVIDSGVDLSAFRRPPRTTRADYGVPDGVPVVATVSRLDPVKGVDIALEAFARVRSTAHWLVAGSGPQREALIARAHALGVSERVHFLGPVDDVPSLLATADVFLLTSRSEGLGLSVVEALAAGLPCVVTRVGGLPELVTDGVNGLLAASEDVADIGRALERMLVDGEARERMADAASASVARFDAASTATAYRQLYTA